MRIKIKKFIGLLFFICWGFSAYGMDSFKLENQYLCRVISTRDGILKTIRIQNKRIKKDLNPLSCNEFSLRISKGVGSEGTDQILTNKDFLVKDTQHYQLKDCQGTGYLVRLKNESENITLEVYYELAESDFYCRKYIKVIPASSLTLERIDVEDLEAVDALQPYTVNKIYARGEWKPNLGQPLYTKESALFLGIEFPAAVNTVVGNRMQCGYLVSKDLKPGEAYCSYKSVIGVADDKDYIDDAFLDYIDCIRKRPLRLQVQYNSWFDFGQKVSKANFAQSVSKINDELVIKRSCKPLNAYVIDDGWQVNDSVTQDTIWRINKKFDRGFSGTFNLVHDAKSSLGLWLSPGCFFGAKPMVAKFRNLGLEALDNSMSLTGPKYMQKLEDRVLELTKMGVAYFKFDGTFGHLHIRDFELKGRGTPYMPQFGLPDTLSANSPLLNDSKYDELKTYYLTKGTERLIQIFDKMAEINPAIYISITNGAYLSPWWLQYIDAVWLINAGDAAGGADRTGELVYRDNVYYQIWKKENTKYPINSIFNHEPKKNAKNKEEPDVFRNYLFMNLSRGTGFIELYLKTDSLKTADWDVLAEGLKWSYEFFPAFQHVRMVGGNPSEKEVYGYVGWGNNKGYLSLHNPSDTTKTFEMKLDRATGFFKNEKPAKVVFQLSDRKDVPLQLTNGQIVSIKLQPKEILVIGYQF
ncbi:MAG TPA: hypothetical protein VFP20_02615 [Bacteroidales bacterium]|nr:hypothetical protein [Bacteroidales bacterium]